MENFLNILIIVLVIGLVVLGVGWVFGSPTVMSTGGIVTCAVLLIFALLLIVLGIGGIANNWRQYRRYVSGLLLIATIPMAMFGPWWIAIAFPVAAMGILYDNHTHSRWQTWKLFVIFWVSVFLLALTYLLEINKMF